MSPWAVVAWMFRSAAPSFLRPLLMRPWVVPASRQAETPAAARTEIEPAWVASTTVPRLASAIWMSPLAVRICASPPRRPTETSPSTVVRRALAASSSLMEACELSKATGYGELLGVVFGGPGLDGLDVAGTDPRAHLVSRIGQDPVRCAGALTLRVRAFIEGQLADPRLTTAAVARARHVPLRYLTSCSRGAGERGRADQGAQAGAPPPRPAGPVAAGDRGVLPGMRSAARSATAMTGALVLLCGVTGITGAST